MVTFLTNYVAKIDWEGVAATLLEKLLSLLVLVLVFVVAKSFLHWLGQKVIAPSFKLSRYDEARQQTLTRLTDNTLKYVLYFFVAYSALAILGLPVSSLLAGAGIFGVAIGLGAQGFLSDLVNGFFILLERQYDVGDFVRVTNGSISLTGTVISVGIRTTQIRDADGTLHFVPNRNILVVSNQSRGAMRARIDLPLAATVDLGKVAQVIAAINERELPRHENVTACSVLGPVTTPSGQFYFRVDLSVIRGQHNLMYYTFYTYYQEALLAAGIPLVTGVIPQQMTEK